MKPRNVASVIMWLALLLMLEACQCPPAQIPLPMQDNVTPLIQHPQFKAAAIAVPEFTQEALNTIIRLSKDNANATK